MNPNDIPSAAIALAQCRAILGGEYDPMRIWWDKEAGRAARSILLQAAGRPTSSLYSVRTWCDLPAELRADITRRARDLRDWLATLPLDNVRVVS